MENNITPNVHPFCDICGSELTNEEIGKNLEFENYEFPFCDTCFSDAIKKLKYILEN